MIKEVKIFPTLIWYYYICPREVWFMARYIVPEQDNTNIALGRLVNEESYSREKKEVRIENIVIDIIKKENEEIIVGEVKKSSRYKESARMQLLYYLYILKQKGLNLKGELLFPKEREKITVELKESDEIKLLEDIQNIEKLIKQGSPPKLVKTRFCAKCGYRELCFA
jgi:CRISPR-associated exonuclease Cas4